ncbi:hypothetical protein [Microvirga terricola]|uniref:Uncharacterized protein n=1 Tax=Microvirga terricola TaxID=2719797 RepID=A0ABX0VB56_9HYPH|nr:hypothetical protein [Microvirga terricola]NIX76296.1 hypothetical protein [Microvirga terricola]
MIRRRPQPPPDRSARSILEEALDAALIDTVPASDSINPSQWTELLQEELATNTSPDEASEEARIELYLKGPTAFSA